MSRRSSRASLSGAADAELKLDCKAAYLSVFEDIRDEIRTEEDLISVLQQAGRNPTRKTIKKYWNDDVDHLTFDDFVDICRKEQPASRDDLIKAFKKIDLNGDGFISLDELYKLLTTRGEKLSREEVKTMLDEVDENGDGKLDYNEFCNMVISTAEECKKVSLKVMEKKERKKAKSAKSSAAHLEKSGSQISLKSAKSAQASISGSRQSLLSVDDLPRPNPRTKKRAPVAGKVGRAAEPGNLKEWTHTKSRGCFFIDSDEGEVISHQYRLNLPIDDTVWITMQPVKIGDADVLSDTPVDTAVFVFKASRDRPGSFVACTEQRDGKGKYYMECKLDAGEYVLVPFTTGCRFKPRTNEPPSVAKLVKKKDEQIALTTKFKKALEDIFDMMDLDGNGLLSREEFNWFNVRTSGEEVADEEWEVVEENVDLENGELTKRGFLKLNEMEAVDSDGDTEDLWITLTNMGFNKSLIIDEACPFQLDVHTENCDDAELSVRALESQREVVDAAICQLALQKGSETRLRSSKDVSLYSYQGEARASIVADNRGFSSARVLVDCSRSRNVISSIGDLETTATVPSSAQKLVFHLLPDDERQEWTVQCSEK